MHFHGAGALWAKGWELSRSLDAKIVVDALDKALETRGEVADITGQRLFHSDRESRGPSGQTPAVSLPKSSASTASHRA